LSQADIVFEAVAEGGITRFMAMVYCDVQRDDTALAPIRSARTYYVDWASGFNYPLYVHVGGANVPGPSDALGQINQYGWAGQSDLNQFSIGYPTFVRDYNRVPGKQIATEHTMVTSTEKLWDVGIKRKWTNMSPALKVGRQAVASTDWKAGYKGWTFSDDAATKGTVSSISYDFWSGYSDYSVSWSYDAASNSYLRSQGGEKHTDINNDKQVAVKNLVVLQTAEKGPINELKHMLYTTTGTGTATIFKDGQAIDAKWAKTTRESELTFTDAKGAPIAFNRGMVWISVLDVANDPTY
ncbi:MAG: DUF3048 domain-containing protein, partial [bacterium]|nr:DUF3048 domain-containing protein [bacterium]